MALPSVTYVFANSTTADATAVNQNFSDIINSITDGTKSLTLSALTLNSTLTANGSVILGTSLSNSLTINAALASSIQVSSGYAFDIGTSTSSIRALYFQSSDASAHTVKLTAGITGTSYAMALPTAQGAANSYLKNDGSGNLSWNASNVTVQKFLTGTAATYTTPANVLYIRVRMAGAGGGGGGSGSNSGTAPTDGGNTTFGTSLLVANGGKQAPQGANSLGGAGGTASLGSGPVGIANSGTQGGCGPSNQTSGVLAVGGSGGFNVFGGSGAGGNNATTGFAGVANTGGGGGGAGISGNGSLLWAGAGGGGGGYVDAIIVGPSATYTYTVGTGGTAGAAGTGGQAGGAGADGIIIVEEYYR